MMKNAQSTREILTSEVDLLYEIPKTNIDTAELSKLITVENTEEINK